MHSDYIIDKLSEFFEIFENGPVSPKGMVQFYHVPNFTSKKFPQLSHILLERGEPHTPSTSEGEEQLRSPLYNFFKNIVFEFLDSKNIEYGEVMRACLNLQYAHVLPHTDPHIDSYEDHYVVLIYLNDSNGDTIIYNETSDISKYPGPVLPYEHEHKVKEYINPEKGKIVCFDGKHYHANYFPDVGRLRLVCVFNISKNINNKKMLGESEPRCQK